jgi:hypothetical protein
MLIHHSRAGDFAVGSGDLSDGMHLRQLARVLDAVAALAPGRRLVVDCRTFAVLACGVLREHGVPARVRFGFASYLGGSHAQSHVVCEWHNGREWVRTDPDTSRLTVDPDEFRTAGEAWRMAPPEVDLPEFGYGPGLCGRWAVRWELVRDLAALTGHEMLTSDVWGLNARLPGDATGLPAHQELLDAVADAETYSRRRELAAEPLLAVPRVITAAPYLGGYAGPVDLAEEGSWAG